jgi:hypothetical protein
MDKLVNDRLERCRAGLVVKYILSNVILHFANDSTMDNKTASNPEISKLL